MKNQIRRIYPYADANMLSATELFYKFYVEHLALFVMFDPVLFVETYGDDFKTSIDTGFSVERDSLVTDRVSQEGAEVADSIETLLDHYDTLAYYVDKCFAQDPDIRKQFHHRTLSLLKKSPAELILWSEELCRAFDNHKAALIASGYSEDAALLLTAAKEALHKSYSEQQEALKRRPEKTAERVVIFNGIWQTVLEIHEAAKRIFRTQPEIMALFELPKQNHKRPAGEETVQESSLSDESLGE